MGLTIKLAPGVTARQAANELQRMHERFAEEGPQYYYPESPFRTEVVLLKEAILGRFATTLYALLAAVGFLLLLACSNIASLLLARAKAREAEIATRLSLGAGRMRIIQQLLTESVLLSLAGGAAGVLLATSE